MTVHLQINEDRAFQDRFWIVQRIGWVGFAMILAAAGGALGYSEGILRAAAIYFLILLVLRLAGRRTLGQMTIFDLALLLIISEATQGALVGGDQSLAGAAVAIVTLIGLDILLSLVKRSWPSLDKVIDGRPTLLIAHGSPIEHALRRSRTELHDILEAARISQGIANASEIEFAILEPNGEISIIPVRRPEP